MLKISLISNVFVADIILNLLVYRGNKPKNMSVYDGNSEIIHRSHVAFTCALFL